MRSIISKSHVLLTGVVVKSNLQSDFLNIKRPVFELEVYNDTQDKWIRDIYVVFSENGDARRSKGIKNGYILCVEGELSFFSQEGKYVVFVQGYSVCSKDNDIAVAKTVIAESIGFLNSVSLIGEALFCDKNIVTARCNILGDYRGNISKTSTQPLYCISPVSNDAKRIIFTGKFVAKDTTVLEGECYEIS